MEPGKTFPLQRNVSFTVSILAALFITAACIWVYLANQPKQVEFVHNQESRLVETKAQTVEEFLIEQHVLIDEYDVIEPSKTEPVKQGLKISYTDKWPVTIQEGEQEKEIVTNQLTVADVLEEQQISLGEWDRTEPVATSQVKPEGIIAITRVVKEIVEEEQKVPFNEVKRKDYLLGQGEQKVIQEGREGKAVQRYEVVYENGKEASRTLVETKVIQTKQDRVVAIGTLTTVSRGGVNFAARKVLNNVVLTAYSSGVSHTGKGPDHPQYGITATGKRAQEGRTIAVDPSVIPMGTWVYIEGVGFRRAEDKGGAVKGNKIDIFFENDLAAHRFGKRKSKAVYVIGKTKPE
ncbi:3D domain-containing protein [Ammoniphilus sp. YIM 78166]|uniref:3D domain-containing protein n=1 Tax=Ammoniphilus sp. YIM 78166 TaxID=1644106 RepID=UPI00106F8E50|nr:3D domain-containing protein [Ammoniphilus sp. YIM 78166]